ncbi:MAG: PAS domain S-box protein [Mesorhizobium sp.]|nr:MAG: PAS domain S-box protein [Mesorhizobium sp.]
MSALAGDYCLAFDERRSEVPRLGLGQFLIRASLSNADFFGISPSSAYEHIEFAMLPSFAGAKTIPREQADYNLSQLISRVLMERNTPGRIGGCAETRPRLRGWEQCGHSAVWRSSMLKVVYLGRECVPAMSRRPRVQNGDKQDEQGEGQRPLSDSDLLRLIFDSATDFAIFTTDPNGITTSWNVGAERVLGYADDEIIGKSADVAFPPEEGGVSAAAEERRIALAEGRAEDERWQMKKDGTRFWASGLLMPLADRTQGFVKILRDRTAQHRAEAQLEQSEELFRVLATNIPQLVFRSKANGDRTWGSPQWSVFTGLAFADSVGFGWLDAVHPEDHDATMSAWADAPTKGEYYCEHRIRRSVDGEYRWHQTRAVPLDDAGGVALEWVGTSTDIHDLRTLKDQQKVLLAELQHRTRNLIAVVQSLARQTMRSSASLDEFAEDYESRLRALSRVQGLLARADHQPIDLRELIEGELHAHGDGSVDGGNVTIEGPATSLPAISAQSVALALHELATNAVKYGALHQPSGRLAVSWNIEHDGSKARARLEWLESGVTMPEGGPTRKGYGSELLERALPYELGAKTKIEFGSDGVRYEIVVPVTKDE